MNSFTARAVVYACIEGADEVNAERRRKKNTSIGGETQDSGIVAVKPKINIVFKYSTHGLLCMFFNVNSG